MKSGSIADSVKYCYYFNFNLYFDEINYATHYLFREKYKVNHIPKYLYGRYLFDIRNKENLYDLQYYLCKESMTITAINDIEINPVRSNDVVKFLDEYLVKL